MTDNEEKWLEPLRARFVASLPALRESLLRNRKVGDCDELIERAHKIAGIAGMMGAPEVGEAALQFEEALRSKLEGGAEFDALICAIDRITG